MKKTIAILIGFLPDPRMTNRINLLKKIGNLHVICWDKGRNMLQQPQADGYDLHVIRIEAGTDPIRRMIPYSKFAKEAKKMLGSIKPDLIDVQGLDMLKLANSYKKTANKKVSIIYEVADLHRLIVDSQTNPVRKLARKYLIREDRQLESSYEKLIITSMAFNQQYFKNFVDQSKVFYMPNVPDLSAFRDYIRKTDGPFTVGFIGSVRYKQQMRNLIEASQLGSFHVLIAGYEEEPSEIEPMCLGKSNIEWIGPFDFIREVAGLYGRCDAIYSVYDADMTNVRVALPNKLYESVYCRLPIIVAKGTYLEQIVQEWGVGIGVDHHSVDDLVKTVNEIKGNQQFYKQCVDNCRLHQNDISLSHYNVLLEQEINSILNQ